MDVRAGAGPVAGGSRTEAIDLTEDDDDDVEVVGMNQAPGPRRAGQTGPLWRDLHRESFHLKARSKDGMLRLQ